MKCSACGTDCADSARFCTNCGNELATAVTVEETRPETERDSADTAFHAEEFRTETNSFVSYLLGIDRRLFLAICILISVSTVLSLPSFPVFKILFTIFFWIIYAKLVKGEVDAANLRCVSGTLFAEYVVNWCLIGLLLLAAVICLCSAGLIGSAAAVIPSLIDGEFSALTPILSGSFSIGVGVVFVVLLLIAGGMIFFNVSAHRSFHHFVKSLYKSAESGTNLIEKAKTAKGWMMALGIIVGIGAVFCLFGAELVGFLVSGADAAAYFIGYVILKKYFLQN